MKKKSLVILAMLKSLFEFISLHKEKLMTTESGKNILNKALPQYEKLISLLPVLTITTKEITAKKEALRTKLIEQASFMIECIKSYNILHADSPFVELAIRTMWQYKRLKGQNLLHEISHLLELIQNNNAAALEAGLKAEDISELNGLFSEYSEKINDPLNTKEKVRLAGVEVNNLIDFLYAWHEVHFFIFMKREFSKAETDFYTEYTQSLKKNNIPTHKRAVAGSIKDAKTSEGLSFVYVKIDGQKARKHGGKKGNYFIQNLSDGIHTLHFSLPGYMPQEHKINVVHGKTCELDVKLVPELVGLS